MKVLTIVVRIFLLAILGAVPVFVAQAAIRNELKRRTAPKQDQHWEDIKQMMPENASDLDTPERIAERRRIAADASR